MSENKTFEYIVLDVVNGHVNSIIPYPPDAKVAMELKELGQVINT